MKKPMTRMGRKKKLTLPGDSIKRRARTQKIIAHLSEEGMTILNRYVERSGYQSPDEAIDDLLVWLTEIDPRLALKAEDNNEGEQPQSQDDSRAPGQGPSQSENS